MKTLSILSVFAALALSVQAAPTIDVKDLSEEKLQEIATERQKKSLDSYNSAVKKAEDKRDKAVKKAKEITDKNDAGLKKTIQRRHLNTMLPPCEREPEAPRDPEDYSIEY
ncbi:MAG: hypothetical protein IKT79_07790 [Akkermansia sp.]|nr:hypothetical protein [Akkermansia sp.]